MTRLAVSRALVSATTLPPLTTSCGEPTPGLAHGINSSRLPIPRCAIDMQRRHPTRSRREAGVATLTPGPRICLSASSGAAGTKGSSRRGARVRAYRQRTCLQQLATSGHLFSGLACASIAPTRRVLRRRSVAMPVRRRMSAMVGSFGGYLPNVRLPVRLCSFSSSPGPADAPRLRVTAALSGPSNSPPARAAPANIPAASSASCGSSA